MRPARESRPLLTWRSPSIRSVHCGIDAERDDMHGLVVAPGNRDLDPIDKAQPNFGRRRARLRQAAEFVVIGQRQQFDTVFLARRTTSAKARAVRRTPSNGNADQH
jgi:hypothetical protein